MMNSVVRYIVLGAVLFAACGGDDDDDASKGTMTSPQAKADEKICIKETCKLPPELKGEELCCMDPFTGGCGIKVTDMCRAYPKVDTRCPPPEINVPTPAGIMPRVFGCCTDDNQCGIDFGMGGCRPRTFACMFVPKAQVDMLKPQTCDGEAVPLPENCGSNMVFMLPGVAGSGS